MVMYKIVIGNVTHETPDESFKNQLVSEHPEAIVSQEADPTLIVKHNCPQIVTSRQIRLAMIMSGVTMEQIATFINSLEEPQKTMAQIEWEYANEFDRDHQMVGVFANFLQMTDEQVDALWVLASTL